MSLALIVVVPVLFHVIVPLPVETDVTAEPLPPVFAVSLHPVTVPAPDKFVLNVEQVTVGALAEATPEAKATEPSEVTANIAAIAATRVDKRSMESPQKV